MISLVTKSLVAGAATVLLCSTALTQQALQARSVSYELNIPAENLDAALQALALASHHQLFYRAELVAGKASKTLIGSYTTEEAVRQLLEGTQLSFEITPASVVLIKALDDKPSNVVPNSSRGSAQIASPGPSDDANAKGGGEHSSQEFRLAQLDQGKNSSGVSVTNGPSTTKGDISGQNEGLAEIIVTAQKREERLQDVPIPVTVLSADTLVDRNQLSLADYFTSVPGLSFTKDAYGASYVTIRGITTGALNGVGNPTVSTTVDDVPYGASTAGDASATPDVDPSDLARIEVLRGPQGALYGASNIGGVIKYVTVDPSTDSLEGFLQAGTTSIKNGDGLGYSIRGAVNVPLSDTLAVRMSAYARRDPGYIDNIETDQQGVNRHESEGGRISALWRPSQDFSLKIGAFVQERRNLGADTVNTSPMLGDLQQAAEIGTGTLERDLHAYSANLNAKIAGVDLASITGYNTNKTFDVLDYTPYFVVPGYALYNSYETRKFSQELRLSAPIGTHFEWMAGFYYDHERSPASQTINTIDLTNGNPYGVPFLIATGDLTYREYAFFGNLTVHFTDQFSIQFGGRESDIKESYTSSIAFPNSDDTALAPPTIQPLTDSSAKPFTFLVTPQFKISPDLMVYARMASGFRPGGTNGLAPVAGFPTQYNPDKTKNYEVGVKGDALEKRLSFDASVYYIDWKNIQLGLFTPPSPEGQFGYVGNAGSATSKGVELSVTARPLSGMTIAAWVGWNRAELTAGIPQPASSYAVAGDKLPFSSPWSGSISLDQDFPIVNNVKGFAGATISYVDQRSGGFQTIDSTSGIVSPPVTLPMYVQTDIRAGSKFDSWTVNVFANNVTDRRGVLAINPAPVNTLNYIQPRTIGVAVGKKF